MTKKIIVFALLSCYFSITIEAQVSTNNKELKRAGEELRLETNSNYQKALSLAREKGWPLVIRGKNNSVSKLVGVDEFGLPKYYSTYNNTIAAATTGTSQLWPGGSTGLNLSGSTAAMKNKMAIWDDGSPLTTHQELTGRVTVKDAGTPGDHATHVAGTMIASGVNPVAKGMSFGAQGIISYDFGGFTGLDVPKMFTEANNGLLLSNHSYGATAGWAFNSDSAHWEFYGEVGATEDYKFGYYDLNAQLKDSIAYNAPFYLIVTASGNNRAENGPAVGQPYYRFNAAGKMAAAGNRPAGISSNDSYGIIALDANAKNMLTVGAVNGIAAGYSKAGDVVMSTFSSWGPTDDGRIKPDIVADGVDITSSVATSNSSYATFSGTSMATPNTTGSLFLLQEYYSQLKGGAFMRSATLKGLAIHTADEAGVSPGPDYQYGWGLLDVKNAAAVIKAAVTSNNAASSQHLLYENTLDNAGQASFSTSVVASGNGPLVATICWTDVKGTVEISKLNNPTPKLVNDLDIRITSGGNTYFPWKLDPANPGNAATKGDNILDNVERINIDSVVPGQTYTITVTHKGTLQRGVQAYSLLVSGVGGTGYCAIAPGTNAGAHIDSVVFAGIHNKSNAACNNYNNYTNITGEVQVNQTLPFSVTVHKCDASASSKVVKIFIDYNNNGSFTDAGELVATSAVLSGAGTQTFTGNIVIPAGLATGNYAVMRVATQETTDPNIVDACGTAASGEIEDFRLHFGQPANDAAISTIVSPISGNCANPSEYVVVTIQNKGSVDLSNIPVTAVIKNGATTVATINNTYRGTIAGGASVTYTFQTAFSTVAGANYTITAYTGVAADQARSNDTLISTVSIPTKAAGPAATATICGNQANLAVTSPNSAASYFWYTSATSTTPAATGPVATTSTITADKTYYVSSGSGPVSLGPVSKSVLGVGGYNNFAGNAVFISAAVPVNINFAKLYIGNPGQINFVVADTLSGNRYIPISSTTIDAYVTNPTGTATPPNAGNTPQVPDNPADTGAYFYLNLAVPAGDHVIFINPQGPPSAATIFRNNGVTGSPYPFSIPGVFSIIGNNATPFQSFYYFFYDMKISTGSCPTDRTAVVAGTAVSPTIVQAGDSLVSSSSTGNQWYLNNVAIPNATGKSFKPVNSGFYSVIVTDASGCSLGSNSINFVSTGTVDLNGTQIGLIVSPNPSAGLFNMQFEVKERADLSIEVLNMLGQNVYSKTYPGFIGRFSDQVNLPNAAPGTYILKIAHHNNLYVKKLLISK